jgi:hypothetical protein
MLQPDPPSLPSSASMIASATEGKQVADEPFHARCAIAKIPKKPQREMETTRRIKELKDLHSRKRS